MIRMPVATVTSDDVCLGRRPKRLTRLFPMRIPTKSPMKETTALTTNSIITSIQFSSGKLESTSSRPPQYPQQR
jgi:hypothetical protein